MLKKPSGPIKDITLILISFTIAGATLFPAAAFLLVVWKGKC